MLIVNRNCIDTKTSHGWPAGPTTPTSSITHIKE